MIEESGENRQAPNPSSEGGRKYPAEKSFVPRAEELRVQNRLEEAIAVLKDGLGKNPDYLPARLLLGRCFWEKEMAEEAKIELEQVAGIIEDCLPVYTFLSKVYVQEQKDVAKALEAVRRALYFTSQEVSQKNRPPFKTEIISQAPRESPGVPPAELGVGEPNQAVLEARIKSVNLAIQTDTLAAIFLKQGKPEKALDIYKKILGQDPQNEVVRQKFEALQKKIGQKIDSGARGKIIATLEKWRQRIPGEKKR